MHSAGLETGVQKAAPGVFLGVDNLLSGLRATLSAEEGSALSPVPRVLDRSPIAADAAVG